MNNKNYPYTQDKEDLKKRLTDIQYKVTQESGTERPFTGIYWNKFDDGYYHCIVCDTKLFKSEDKFESHCGWPSFSNESFEGTIEYIKDTSHGMIRTEVRCKNCGAHLGHVFNDGPKPTYQRYCINSASINFTKV